MERPTTDVWTSLPAWRLDPMPALTLGGVEVAEPQLFGNLRGAAWLSDGSIAVADQSTNDVRVFAPDGAHRYSFGRDGRGPGEFREIWGVFVGPGDTIWGFDQPEWSLVGYHEGRYQREIASNRLWPLRWSGTSVVATVTPSTGVPQRPLGSQRDSLLIVVTAADGTRADTVARVLGDESFLDNDRNWQTPLLGRNSFVAAGSDFVVFGDGASITLVVMSTSGRPLRTFQLPQRSGGDLRALAAARRAHRLESTEPEYRSRVEATMNSMPIPGRLTDISGLEVDTEDRIWVRPLHMPADSQPEWNVYDRNGTPLARMRIPLHLRIRQIGDTSLLATERGEYDVGLVRSYRIRR